MTPKEFAKLLTEAIEKRHAEALAKLKQSAVTIAAADSVDGGQIEDLEVTFAKAGVTQRYFIELLSGACRVNDIERQLANEDDADLSASYENASRELDELEAERKRGFAAVAVDNAAAMSNAEQERERSAHRQSLERTRGEVQTSMQHRKRLREELVRLQKELA